MSGRKPDVTGEDITVDKDFDEKKNPIEPVNANAVKIPADELAKKTQIWFDVKVPKMETVEKGKTLTVEANGKEIRLIRKKKASALKFIDNTTWEVLEDIEINMGKIIPAGTDLDPKKDKDLLDLLREAAPESFAEPKDPSKKEGKLAKLKNQNAVDTQEAAKQEKVKKYMDSQKKK